MALLAGLIPEQNFELVRDRIGEILASELANQMSLSSPPNADLNPDIWVERLFPFAETELPAINVLYGQTDFGNKDAKAADGTNTYYIDCHFQSPTTDEGRGDKLASIKAQRLAGMVRAILENPQYRTLGFDMPSISRVWVQAIRMPDPSTMQEATNQVAVRVELNVRVPENVQLLTGTAFSSHFTTVKLSNTDKGYLYISGELSPP